MSQLIIHIVPQLPPEICGVGDYATLVGSKIEELQPGLRCAYLACGYRAIDKCYDDARFAGIRGSCNVESLWRAVGELADKFASDKTSLILHYSGYGYDMNGAPTWIATALENRPSRFVATRLTTFFHELYATGRPWQRAFWMSGLQRAVAVRVAQASDELVTNRAVGGCWLEQVTGRAESSIPRCPVPSNVGELAIPIPFAERSPIAVMFGAARFKRQFFDASTYPMVLTLCQRLGIQRLISLGQAIEDPSPVTRSSKVEFLQLGFVSGEVVSSYFQDSRIAFVEYFPQYYAKSGVFAAAAAHAVAPIVKLDAKSESDGLYRNKNYLALQTLNCVGSDELVAIIENVSNQVFVWYQNHNICSHAARFLELLGKHLQISC